MPTPTNTLPNGQQYSDPIVNRPLSKSQRAARNMNRGLALSPVLGPLSVPMSFAADNIYQKFSGMFNKNKQQPTAPVAPTTPTAPVAPYTPPQDGGMSQDMMMGGDYSQQMSQGSGYDNSMLGFGSLGDLAAAREKMAYLQARTMSGLPITDEEAGQALGIDSSMKYSPQQIAAIRSAKADYFTAPLNAMDKVLNNANSGGGGDTVSQGQLSGTPVYIAKQVWSDLDKMNSSEDAKAYFAAQRSNQLIQSVDPNSANSSQMQGIISDYAKGLDPISVVRESEYALAQKYGQSGLRNIEGNIKQWISGKGMLSPQAIEALQIASGARMESLAERRKQQLSEFDRYAEATYGVKNGSNLIYNPTAGNEGRQPTQQYKAEYTVKGVDYYRNPTDNKYYPIPKASGTSGSPVTSLSDAKMRIARNEGNNYMALGPVVKGGQYNGQRALGKYQVMPGNVPSWTKEALGVSLTPQQFLSSPQAQEKVADYKMMALYKKYGNWSDVASAWFTGGPLNRQSAQKKDVLGTSNLAYVNKFNS